MNGSTWAGGSSQAAGATYQYGVTPPTIAPEEEAEAEPTSPPTPSAAVDAAKKWAKKAKQKVLYDEFVARCKALGIDLNDPGVAPILQMLASTEVTGQTNIALVVDVLVQQAMTAQWGGASPWTQALIESGFAEQVTAEAAAVEGARPSPYFGPPAVPTPEFPYGLPPGEQVTTGWLMPADGVLVNPNDGTVTYDPNKAPPGSLPWTWQIQRTWDQNDINRWRARLVEYRYLPKEEKKGGWDDNFVGALMEFHYTRYQNGGTAIPKTSEGGAASASDLMPMRNIRGQIANDVRDQFVRVFGDLPSQGELEEWVNFVIRTVMRLQRKAGLSAPEAAAEAEARMFERLSTGPAATLLNEAEEENTALHDSILRTIYAMQGMV